jgi:hypothetical protein
VTPEEREYWRTKAAHRVALAAVAELWDGDLPFEEVAIRTARLKAAREAWLAAREAWRRSELAAAQPV